PLWAAMSASFDRTKEKYAKRNEVSYDKKDPEGEEQVPAKPAKNNADKPVPAKKPDQGKKPNNNNTVYKYSKKNTQFKKKK
ncbi:MAG: hypothetical protein J5815_01675, partial [Clostridia bacterium]|nr:hypothetical protein [Clostridia bacterium]